MTVNSSPASPPPTAGDDLASELLSAHRQLLDSIGEKTHLSGLLQQFCGTLDNAIEPTCSCVMLYQPVERTLNCCISGWIMPMWPPSARASSTMLR